MLLSLRMSYSTKIYRSTKINLNHRLQKWLQDAIQLCTGVKQSDKLSVTRRSAGLPYLILVN